MTDRRGMLIFSLAAAVAVGLFLGPRSHPGSLPPAAGVPGPGAACADNLRPAPRPILASPWWLFLMGQTALVAGRAAERPPGEPAIVIDTAGRTLTLLAGGKEVRRYPVAVGKPATPSPVGEWRIVHKSYNWGGGFGTRWLGLNVPWGIYGIHGTNKPGSIGANVSGGCIRMFNAHVEELFSWVPAGTPVTIVGPRPAFRPRSQYRSGTSGPDVVFLQRALREHGFSPGMADARYGPATEAAVRRLELFYGLPPDGVAGEAVQLLAGFRRTGREGG